MTGLDPAGPMFEFESCSNQSHLCRLHPSDATQVNTYKAVCNQLYSYESYEYEYFDRRSIDVKKGNDWNLKHGQTLFLFEI